MDHHLEDKEAYKLAALRQAVLSPTTAGQLPGATKPFIYEVGAHVHMV